VFVLAQGRRTMKKASLVLVLVLAACKKAPAPPDTSGKLRAAPE
jgi:hypothetical protein